MTLELNINKMEKRYLKNENTLSREENLSLREKRVAVLGCGGLGGYIIEQIARLGIGHITVIDGDVFDESNLNRQLLSTVENIGRAKVLAAQERIEKVNPDIKVVIHNLFLNEENALDFLQNHDVICDALDNLNTRILLQESASLLQIPLVHGAIAGWYGQVTTLFPGFNIPGSLFRTNINNSAEQKLGNPSFISGLIASIQVSEIVKILSGKGRCLRNRLMIIDTLEHDIEVIDLHDAKPTLHSNKA